ncbi:exodeoxyribonuclease VII small subunit [Oricola sp.]|uniref:exodeoxyribonuclease VII small subunit n=1 Tax=Oricola sp. TaxID=1979950 RepID=UPI0025CC8DB6|nr:exodeoxyribonuclease VII small subunit [Oricola sp.]MCI5076718.1 exodeoxyribonuclease VII small subunit [Oricola sp.]
MADAPNHANVKDMNFETALKQLEDIVDQLERGDVPLDKSIEIYERGEALRNRCDALLKAAEAKIEKIKLTRDGKPAGTEPLDG